MQGTYRIPCGCASRREEVAITRHPANTLIDPLRVTLELAGKPIRIAPEGLADPCRIAREPLGQVTLEPRLQALSHVARVRSLIEPHRVRERKRLGFFAPVREDPAQAIDDFIER